MSQLIKIAGWSKGPPCAAVIFIHGLGGHPYDTWRRASEDHSLWPLWLAKDVLGLAVWTLAYEAPASNWLGTAMPLQDRAKNVLECLVGERELRGLPIVFVCHSLGGLLIKQVLRSADDRRGYGDAEAQAFVESVKGIVFIATPHSGSEHASLLDKLRLITWPSASTLDLVKNNANLRDLNVWYRNWSSAIRHKVFYEVRGTSAGVVVTADSGDPGLLHVDPVAIDADHLTICKPADARDLVYSRTRDFITETIDHDTGADHGAFQALELPQLQRQRLNRIVPIALRLAALLILGFVIFTGLRQLLFPPDILGTATVEQIESTLRNRSPPPTTAQIDQFVQSLRNLRGDPSFARAVEEARKGNTRVAEGIWRQIYEDRERARGIAEKEQAQAARNLAASAVTNNVAEGLSWYRKAVALDPDDMEGQIGLGDAATAGGTLQEASDAFRHYMELARRTKNDREVSVGLKRFGAVQVAQGDLAAALKSYRDSLAIADRLATSDPGNAGWQRDLAESLGKVGDVQVAQGDLAAALKSYRDSLAIADRLAKSDPSNAGWQRALAVPYERIGDVQIAQGDLAAALKSYRDSLAIRERLAKSDPANAAWQRNLAVSYSKIGDVQVTQGDLAGALNSYRDSLAIDERLATSDPGNAGWQRDLAGSLNRVGYVQNTQGDLAGALKSYRDCLAIFERLAKSDPTNADWQRSLSGSLITIGEVQVKQGDRAGALKSYRDGLAIFERLAKSDPTNTDLQRNLSVSYRKVGDAQVAQGGVAGALKSYRDSLAIFERLAKSDPGNAGWQRELLVSYSKIGDVQVEQGDHAGALKSYRDSLAIADHLAKSDSSNALWQRDLAMSLNRVGNVQVAQGDLAGALKSYRVSLAIRERLAKSDPGNADWQRDLAESHANVARAFIAMGDKAKALDALQVGRDIASRLTTLSRDNARWRQDLIWFERRIEELSK
jgi:tetratricopeptide (TPR) repeat protein